MTVLAAARVGAVVQYDDSPGATGKVVVRSATDGVVLSADGEDIPWDVAMRAGRTDPAPCAPVAPGDPAYIGADEVSVIDVPDHESLLGRAVSALADRVPVDLTGARP